MRIFRTFFSAAAAAVIIISALTPEEANAQSRKKRAQYEATIDSLQNEINKLTQEAESRDSLAGEIIDIYERGNRGERFYDNEETDSLLSLWYLHQTAIEEPIENFSLDSVRLESNLPDSVYIRRLKQMNSFITLPYNDVVRNYIILYSEKLKKIGTIMGLSKYYMPIFNEIFSEYDLPEELSVMAIIESALNPLAVSKAGAKGMWQFMYSTAKMYGLTINSFVDERMDPVTSARAAARYLKDAYDIFGDWSLAIASYNCGAGNVNKAIRRSGGKRAFWDIYPYLPRETRGYVPAFVGALYTLHYYKEHGIVPEASPLPPAVDTFKIHQNLHLKQVNELAGIPMDDLHNLNPQYRHDIVPGNEKEYILRIPYNYVNNYVDVEDSLYAYKADEFFNPVNIKKIKDGGDGERVVYKVRSGDTLSKIASKYRVTVNQIKRWNNLSSTNIRIGQNLVIYRGGGGPSTSASSSSSSSSTTKASSSSSSSSSSSGGTVYTVKKGDTLYDIAKRYPGVSAKNIMDYNGMSSSKIKVGMKLKIPAR